MPRDLNFCLPLHLLILCFVHSRANGNAEESGSALDEVAIATDHGKSANSSAAMAAKTFNKLIDDYTLEVVIIVQYCIISTGVNLFGIVTNTLNIITFFKQGFGETINISLLGLAFSDMGNLITLQWLNICFAPFVLYSDIPFYSLEVQYLTAGWPRMAFTRITAWITAFITFERCLCITMPLKVKMLITPRRTVIIIVSIFVLLIGSISPTYYTSRLVWKFFPKRNRTLLGLGFTADREEIDSKMFAINNVFLPIVAFITVIVCTVILIHNLNKKSKWRKKSTKNAQQIATKDKRIVKMVTIISTIFIICFFPNAIMFSGMAAEPEFNIDGGYSNTFIVTFSYCFILESINSSINIFLYWKMSSKFRETFNRLFHSCKRK